MIFGNSIDSKGEQPAVYTASVLEITPEGDAIVELPPELLAHVGWKEGDTLDLKLESGYLVLKKVVV
jgi:formylmethanofuran dehydrogenase subunit D